MAYDLVLFEPGELLINAGSNSDEAGKASFFTTTSSSEENTSICSPETIISQRLIALGQKTTLWPIAST
jgi:hypothetical protein